MRDVVVVGGTNATEARSGRTSAALLTHTLTGLLITDIALAASGLIVPAVSHYDYSTQLDMALRPFVVLGRTSFILTVVVFLIWFYRARVNAELSGWPQRRARAWAFWGWVVPIANLWVPFQIMRDIWRACLPPSRRGGVPWLPAVWWASWLFTCLLVQSWNAARSRDGIYGLAFPANWTTFGLLAVAGISLIAISQQVSRQRQDRRPDFVQR